MREISTTVTAGTGSERHNHDLDYRATLEHVHSMPGGVIELVPYKPYKEQINELVKPYIEKYNKLVEARYKSAWDRYNAGIIKTKPRKRDYKPISYDYYSEHLEDTYYNKKTNKKEALPIFRSLIVGLGDQEDRTTEKITEAEAIRVFSALIEKWKEDFPDFVILGATIHLDEAGFYHCHIDYKPFYENNIGQGLGFGIGHDAALERMGFEPEQSIINGSDKVPILFNAFRNKVYRIVEEGLASEDIRLQYGVSKIKEPEKDSSKNQKMENWQHQQDDLRKLQHEKNKLLDSIEDIETSPDKLKTVIHSTVVMEDIIKQIENTPQTRINKNKVVIQFHLFDQLKSYMQEFKNIIAYYSKQLEAYKNQLTEAWNELTTANDYIDQVEPELKDLRQKYSHSKEERDQLSKALSFYKKENQKKDKFLEQYSLDGSTTLKEAYERQERQKEKEKEQGL